jgi:hypothetical protein
MTRLTSCLVHPELDFFSLLSAAIGGGGWGAEPESAPDGGDGGGDEVEAVDDGELFAALALLHGLRREPVLDREEGPCQCRQLAEVSPGAQSRLRHDSYFSFPELQPLLGHFLFLIEFHDFFSSNFTRSQCGP